jgi:hypothetical protein
MTNTTETTETTFPDFGVFENVNAWTEKIDGRSKEGKNLKHLQETLNQFFYVWAIKHESFSYEPTLRIAVKGDCYEMFTEFFSDYAKTFQTSVTVPYNVAVRSYQTSSFIDGSCSLTFNADGTTEFVPSHWRHEFPNIESMSKRVQQFKTQQQAKWREQQAREEALAIPLDDEWLEAIANAEYRRNVLAKYEVPKLDNEDVVSIRRYRRDMKEHLQSLTLQKMFDSFIELQNSLHFIGKHSWQYPNNEFKFRRITVQEAVLKVLMQYKSSISELDTQDLMNQFHNTIVRGY